MSVRYIRLATAPTLVIQYPQCSACGIDVEVDADGMTCPCCGTSWSHSQGEDDPGTLYQDWAGEEATGPIVDKKDARRWGDYHVKLDLHRISPDFFPAPTKPSDS